MTSSIALTGKLWLTLYMYLFSRTSSSVLCKRCLPEEYFEAASAACRDCRRQRHVGTGSTSVRGHDRGASRDWPKPRQRLRVTSPESARPVAAGSNLTPLFPPPLENDDENLPGEEFLVPNTGAPEDRIEKCTMLQEVGLQNQPLVCDLSAALYMQQMSDP